jgi:hypothetical protein
MLTVDEVFETFTAFFTLYLAQLSTEAARSLDLDVIEGHLQKAVGQGMREALARIDAQR